jgi:thymidylate kinase
VTVAAPLLELVGVAGAGKTTLLRTLKQQDPRLSTDATIGRFSRAEHLIRHTAGFLPTYLRRSPRGRWFSWEEMRAMGYLEGWRRVIGGDRTAAMVFDHGPIFRLVQLRELGPPLVASPAFATWWHAERRAWERSLDLVVWLDAPDAVLLPRIGARDQRHVVKHMPAATAVEFLTTYRRGYEKVLAEMSAEGRFHLIRFDTSQMPPEAMAEEVLEAVRRVTTPDRGSDRPQPGSPS